MEKYQKKMCTFALLTFLFLSLSQNFLLAENHSSENKLNTEFFNNFMNDFSAVLVSPKNWKRQDLLNFSAVLGGGLLLYAVDQDIHEWVQDHRNSSSDLIFLFSSLSQNFLLAENHSSENKLNTEFFNNFMNDFSAVLVSPKNWKRQDLLNFSAVLGGGLLLYAVDQDIHEWVQDHRNSSSDKFFKSITHFGDRAVLAGLIAALYASGELFHNDSLRKTSLMSLESWLTTWFILTTIKIITGRARADTGESSHSFHPFSTKQYNWSLPSGHASWAFSVATVIADQSKNAYIDILSYSLATLVAVSRVHNNKTWTSDNFLGSFLGYFVAKKICALNRNREAGKVRMSLQFSQRSRALSFSISF